MTRKRRKLLVRMLVWGSAGVAFVLLCPFPADGNWVLEPPSRRNHCACDSHDFVRYQSGKVFGVHGNHPPPIYYGSYKQRGWGGFDAQFEYGSKTVAISGYATMLYRIEFSCWDTGTEFSFYVRDLNPAARKVVSEHGGKRAEHLGLDLIATADESGRVRITDRKSKDLTWDELVGLATKRAGSPHKPSSRGITVEQADSTSDVSALVELFKEHEIEARWVKPVVFE